MNNLFNYISSRTCFTFAVAVFSVTGGQIAATLGIIFIGTVVEFKSPKLLMITVVLCLASAFVMGIVHYILFGVSRAWGKPRELKLLTILNDNISSQTIINDIPTEKLIITSRFLDRLPYYNATVSASLSGGVVIVAVIYGTLICSYWKDILGIFGGGLIAWVSYTIFTLIITEIVTSNVRCESRRLLMHREAWTEPAFTTPLARKFAFFLLIMLMSIFITYFVGTSTVITSPLLVITVLSLLTLAMGFLLCAFVFISIMAPLRQIQKSASNLSVGQGLEFLSGSIDREFITTAKIIYDTALKITNYRNQLLELNSKLEKKVQERTSELQNINENLQQEIEKRKQVEQNLRVSENKYKELSITDGLTRLYNKRQLYYQLEAEIERAHRYHTALSVMLLDIDDFKRFNDQWGHLEGDKVLAELGKTIMNSMRRIDSGYRYGGEEFTIILPSSCSAEAAKVAERIRLQFSELEFYPKAGERQTVTVSIGIAEYIQGEDLPTLLDRADKNMYKAKSQGKNRVVY